MARELRKEYLMMNGDNQASNEALARALCILREVTQKLLEGVDKAEFMRQYRGKYVSPGITVRRHVEELRMSGNLNETTTKMWLSRRPVNPTPV
jgi:hypothetical protein